MHRAKGRKILTSRRALLAFGIAALGATLPVLAADHPVPPKPKPKTTPAAARAQTQRARLPKRLATDFRSHIETRLPHLRASFEAAGRETGFPWRMLAALGYQESRWRPAAVSPKGAQGVMMLMPRTATKMGVKNAFSPHENIMAGARYLLLMKESIPKRIRDPDRTLLAMAAYNVGIGHLEDARIITQMRKKNPDQWADVRANLPRLSEPYWHSRVKRGYANGRETAQFVERVSQFAAILEASVPDAVVARD